MLSQRRGCVIVAPLSTIQDGLAVRLDRLGFWQFPRLMGCYCGSLKARWRNISNLSLPNPTVIPPGTSFSGFHRLREITQPLNPNVPSPSEVVDNEGGCAGGGTGAGGGGFATPLDDDGSRSLQWVRSRVAKISRPMLPCSLSYSL